MKVSKQQFEAANTRASQPCFARLRARQACTTQRDQVVIGMNTGIEVAFHPRDAQGLKHAKPHQLDVIEI